MSEPPPARAYHSMTCIGSHYLLFGGFDGKSTYNDLWWLVPEDDPIAKRSTSLSPPGILPLRKELSFSSESSQYTIQESQTEPPFLELRKKLGILESPATPELSVVHESMDNELLELCSSLAGDISRNDHVALIKALREHWKESSSRSIQLKELGPLLRDYQRLIIRQNLENADSLPPFVKSGPKEQQAFRFYHIKNASQLRMDDIPNLLNEYKQLLAKCGAVCVYHR